MSSDSAASPGFNGLARWLHWLIAAAIVLQYVLASLAERAADNAQQLQQLALLANHKSVGITILLLAALRLAWRWARPAPDLPASMPGWQRRASRISHALLYILLLSLPVSGWLMSSASAYTVSWFGLFELPNFIAASPDAKEWLHFAHEALATALFIVALIHILAALKHWLVDKDDVMQRMASKGAITAAVIAAAVVGFALTGVGQGPSADTVLSDNDVNQLASEIAVAGEKDIVLDSKLPAWDIDYAASAIEFAGEQAGASFTGRWPQWRAVLQFDENDLANSQWQVEVEVGKVASGDAERDGLIVGEAWFAAARFPKVRFVAQKFSRGAANGEYIAHGEIDVKGKRVATDFTFTLRADGLSGHTQLDRLALGLGTGEWLDTDWVGQMVDVNVMVKIRK